MHTIGPRIMLALWYKGRHTSPSLKFRDILPRNLRGQKPLLLLCTPTKSAIKTSDGGVLAIKDGTGSRDTRVVTLAAAIVGSSMLLFNKKGISLEPTSKSGGRGCLLRLRAVTKNDATYILYVTVWSCACPFTIRNLSLN